MCDRAIEIGAKTRDDIDCSKCRKHEIPTPENQEFLNDFLSPVMNILVMPNGNVNTGLIEASLNAHDIPKDQRPEYLQKFMIFIEEKIKDYGNRRKN